MRDHLAALPDLPDLIDAFNRSDWPAFRAHLTPDVVYEESGTGGHAEGPDAYIALLQAWHDALPDVHGTVTETIMDGERIAQRISWTGTHTGPLKAGDMTIPATGKAFQVESINWLTLRDMKVARAFHHLDVMGLMQQLGLMTAPESHEADKASGMI